VSDSTPVLIVAFALLGLLFLALAAQEWLSPRVERRAGLQPAAWRGGVILLVMSLLSLAALLGAARLFGWNRDRALWVGIGGFLAIMTFARPWWFWDNWKARWLRNLVGDGPTAGFYLAVAGFMIWVGLFTEWTFGKP
jgi:hypothetical protein